MTSSVQIGQMLPDTDYRILDREDEVREDGVARPIAEGGAGIVFRVRYKGMHRALKVLFPRDLRDSAPFSTLDQEHWGRYIPTFEREVSLLARITHTNIARLLDHGVVEIPGLGCRTPYYVMELVEGPEFLPGLGTVDAGCVLSLLDDVASALSFLHGRRILHADVKSENIRIDLTGTVPRAILLDLGVAKVLSEETDAHFPGLAENSLSYFFSTRNITRDARKDFLKQPVPVKHLKKFFPDHDLFAFGMLVQGILLAPGLATKLKSYLRPPGFEALKLIAVRLVGPVEGQFPGIDAVRNALRKVNPEYMAPMGIPELSMAVNPRAAISMPDARIRMGERLMTVLDNPAVQRLRRLKQLSFVYLGWPGAGHSRLAYSLNRFQLAREYLAHLLEDPRFRLAVDRPDVEAALLFALLRDVGHYPLCHILEDVRASEDGPPSPDDQRIATDTDILSCLLKQNASIPLSLQPTAALIDTLFRDRRNPSVGGATVAALREVVAAHFSTEAQDRLSRLVDGDVSDHASKLLLALFDGPIDVGKVSYLRFDSLMTGVDFGRGIDLDGLLSNLTVPPAHVLDSAGPAMALFHRGLASAESAIVARYWMIQRMYWSPMNRALMAQIRFVISTLRRAGAFTFFDYLRETFFSSHEDAIAYLCKLWDANANSLGATPAGPCVNPLLGVLQGDRNIYRRVLTLNRQWPEDSEVYTRIAFCPESLKERLEGLMANALTSLLELPTGLPLGSVLLDVPAVKDEETDGKLFIVWTGRRTAPRDVFTASPMLQRYSEEFTVHAKKARVFVAPAVAELLEERDLLHTAQKEVMKALRTHFRLP